MSLMLQILFLTHNYINPLLLDKWHTQGQMSQFLKLFNQFAKYKLVHFIIIARVLLVVNYAHHLFIVVNNYMNLINRMVPLK